MVFGFLLYIHPYNIYHHLTAEKRVLNTIGDPDIRDSSFKDNSEIETIKYAGNHIYYIETEKDKYLTDMNRNKRGGTVKIFKYETSFGYRY